jgi:capsular exopolysaccharide synthesis family protein
MITKKRKMQFLANEAYQSLLANIKYLIKNKNLKLITITSPFCQEGKSTITSKLANKLAENGSRVLIMDGDFRKPSIYKTFNVPNNCGISNIIKENASIKEAVKSCQIDNIYILTSGTLPINMAELINNDKFDEILHEAKQIFDFILIDTPALFDVSDGQILTLNSQGTLLVSRYGKTEKKDILKAKEMITNLGGNVLGVIINNVPIKKRKLYYYEK